MDPKGERLVFLYACWCMTPYTLRLASLILRELLDLRSNSEKKVDWGSNSSCDMCSEWC